MKGEIGTGTPSASHQVHSLVHTIAKVASMAKRQVVNYVAVKKRCYVLGAAPVVSALVIGILGKAQPPIVCD